MNLNDRDILTDLLIDKKYISTGYHQALLESADETVRNTLKQIHDDELASHRIVFDMMNSRGYYRVQPAAQGNMNYQSVMPAQQYGRSGQEPPGQYQYETGQQPYGQEGRNW